MTTYYISPTTHPTTPGNDSTGNGSSATPWATLVKFLASSASGDTCMCLAGTYTFATATITNRTISAVAGATVIFDGGGAIVKWTLLGAITISGIKFQNAIANNDVNRSAIFTYGSAVTAMFTNCIFFSLILRPFSNVGGLVGNSDVADVGGNISISFVSCLFLSITCDVGYSQYMFGIRMTVTTARTFSFAFTNCIFYLATTAPLPLNTLFAKSADINILTVVFKNTIIYNALGSTLTYGSGTFTSMITYSNLYLITAAPTATNSITSDPLFENPAAGNFNLRPTSPAINIGSLV